jgi:hypothetical protein
VTPAQFGQAMAVIAGYVAFDSMKKTALQDVEQRERRKRRAFDSYVTYGRITEDYELLSDRAKRASARQRANYVQRKAAQSTNFTAVCGCPQCNVFDFHHIKSSTFRRCIRQCSQCNFTWRQQ